MLIDFVYSYAKDILKEAQSYEEASDSASDVVSVQNVELAIRTRSFAQPISLEVRTLPSCTATKRWSAASLHPFMSYVDSVHVLPPCQQVNSIEQGHCSAQLCHPSPRAL